MFNHKLSNYNAQIKGYECQVILIDWDTNKKYKVSVPSEYKTIESFINDLNESAPERDLSLFDWHYKTCV